MTRYSITLDLTKYTTQLSLSCKNTDVGREIAITFHQYGVPYTLTADNYAVFVAKKPSGTDIVNDCVVDLVNNCVVYTITPQTIAEIGNVPCEIQLFGYDREQIGSPTFNILVRKAILGETDIESSSEYGTLNNIINDVKTRLEDGEFDGKDGINPLVRINDVTHEWEVSYDNGESWQSLDTQAEPRSVYLSSEAGLGLPYSHYQISAVTVPSGMSLKNGDIIIFTNSTFAMAYSVGELNSEEYSCSVAQSFKGEGVPPVTEKDAGKVLATDGTSTAWNYLGIDGLYEAKDFTSQFTPNSAVNLDTVGAVAGAPYASSEYKTLEVACSPGDIFEINGSSGTRTARKFGFVDKDRVILWRLTNNAVDHQNKPIRMTAPDGAAKLICNFAMEAYPGEYVVKIGKYTATPPNVVINDTTEYRYLAPKWTDIFDFDEKAYTNRLNFVGFDELYQAFHNLNEDGFIEEINLSDDYLANNEDAIPENFASIPNAGLYMWHVLPPKDDGNGVYTPKYKRAKLMILGGLHGGEKRSMWNLYFMLKDIKDRATSRAINILRNFFDIYIIPMCNPYGIEQGTRNNGNGVNLNRDFWNLNWAQMTGETGDTYNSQYETRCISWWIKQIKPDIFVDHHTSTGDNSIENGRFLAWGDSYIKSINSLIEETLIELSPIVRNKYYQYLGEYEFVYGHTQDAESYINYGTAPHFAYYNGAISCTFEVVQGVKWDGVRVFDASSDVDQTVLMTIEYFNWINYLLRFVTEAVAMLNGKSRI